MLAVGGTKMIGGDDDTRGEISFIDERRKGDKVKEEEGEAWVFHLLDSFLLVNKQNVTVTPPPSFQVFPLLVPTLLL